MNRLKDIWKETLKRHINKWRKAIAWVTPSNVNFCINLSLKEATSE